MRCLGHLLASTPLKNLEIAIHYKSSCLYNIYQLVHLELFHGHIASSGFNIIQSMSKKVLDFKTAYADMTSF